MACKTRPPACENSTVKLRVKTAFHKLTKIRRILLVGAPGFEPGTSCAQASRAIFWKSFLFNFVFANKRVRKIFGGGTVYRYVAAHVRSPPKFPLSEDKANCGILSQTSFGLSDTCSSALPRIKFSHSVRRYPLGPKLPKLRKRVRFRSPAPDSKRLTVNFSISITLCSFQIPANRPVFCLKSFDCFIGVVTLLW